MSGGVDSSVVAALLHERGCEVVGVTLSLWEDPDPCGPDGGCCTPEDILDARLVCRRIGVPHYLLGWQAAFEEDVVAPFVAAWARGETPNPCVRCNDRIKFDRLFHKTAEIGARWLATGHYARVVASGEGRPRLLRAVDHRRDQSYFLAGMGGAALAGLCLPLGELTKDQVRAEAERLDLPTKDKPDSQDICFIPDGDLAGFLARRGVLPRPGPIVDEEGREVGRHEGVHLVTIGQRRGLGVAGGLRRYVTAIDSATATVHLGSEDALRHHRVAVERWGFLRRPAPSEVLSLQVRSRGRPATVSGLTHLDERWSIELAEPLVAPAPGQAAVLYGGEGGTEVLAAGTVTRWEDLDLPS